MWLVLAGLVWWLWRTRAPAPAPRRGQPARGGALTQMRRCAHCGVHVPADEAVVDTADRPYCSLAHRDLGPTA